MARPKVRDELKALNVKIDAKVYDQLDKESTKSCVPKTAIVEKAINQYIQQKKKKDTN